LGETEDLIPAAEHRPENGNPGKPDKPPRRLDFMKWNYYTGAAEKSTGESKRAVRGAGPQQKRLFRDPAPPRLWTPALEGAGRKGSHARPITFGQDGRRDTEHRPDLRASGSPRGVGTLHLRFINKSGAAVCQVRGPSYVPKSETEENAEGAAHEKAIFFWRKGESF
jgi:hypothetical protein